MSNRSSSRSSLSGYPYFTKRELVIFSPIHERSENELSRPESKVFEFSSTTKTEQLESNTTNVLLDSNATVLLQFAEEPKAITSHCKITEI